MGLGKPFWEYNKFNNNINIMSINTSFYLIKHNHEKYTMIPCTLCDQAFTTHHLHLEFLHFLDLEFTLISVLRFTWDFR